MQSKVSDGCQICGELPVGCHYGAWCCNSCKCFFRRCVIKQGDYNCRSGNNQCKISKESRNACRACRYAKCIAVGLDPNAVHSESAFGLRLPDHPRLKTPDDPVAHQYPSMGSSFGSTSTTLALADSSNGSQLMTGTPQSWLGLSNRMTVEMSTYPLGSISGLLGHQDASSDPLSRYFVTVERLCESYRETSLNSASPHVVYDLNIPVERAFLEPRSLIPRTAVDWEARYLMTPCASYLLPRQWCRVVAFHTDWASHIPELQQLDLDDRVRMLAGRVKQCSWLWVASKSITLAGGQLAVFSDGGCYPLDPVEQARVIRPGLDIQVRVEELALLKVLCFCVPVAGLKPTSLAIMQSAQAKYQAALVEEAMKNPVGEGMLGNIGRLMKMMSWLTTVERLAEDGNKQLTLMTLFNIAEMKGSLPYELHVRSD